MHEGQEQPPESQNTPLTFLRTVWAKIRPTSSESPVALNAIIIDSDLHNPKIMGYCMENGPTYNLILKEGNDKDNVYTIEYPMGIYDPYGRIKSIRGVFKIRNRHPILTEATISYKNKKHQRSEAELRFPVMEGVRVTDPEGKMTIVGISHHPPKNSPILPPR